MSKNKKYWKRRFGNLADKTEPYYHHFDLRQIDDLDDESFAYLIAPVKGIFMLDLNETAITDESIQLLTQLEYVNELRAKGIDGLTDACTEDLNNIKGLELLYVKNTSITIDGLLKLKDQQHLKTILFSADDVEAIKEKLLQLKAMQPNCELVIDGKPYYFDYIERFIYSAKAQPYTYRLKIKDDPFTAPWSQWIIKPSDNYFKTQKQGPYSTGDIECIEVNPIEVHQEGKLIPAKQIYHTDAIVKMLEDLALPYLIVEEVIRVYLVDERL